MVVCAGEHPIGQGQVGATVSADRAELAGWVPTIGFDELAEAPRLLVLQQACEFRPAGIGDSSGQPMVGQHPGHVQVFDNETVVGLDQLVGRPV